MRDVVHIVRLLGRWNGEIAVSPSDRLERRDDHLQIETGLYQRLRDAQRLQDRLVVRLHAGAVSHEGALDDDGLADQMQRRIVALGDHDHAPAARSRSAVKPRNASVQTASPNQSQGVESQGRWADGDGAGAALDRRRHS